VGGGKREGGDGRGRWWEREGRGGRGKGEKTKGRKNCKLNFLGGGWGLKLFLQKKSNGVVAKMG